MASIAERAVVQARNIYVVEPLIRFYTRQTLRMYARVSRLHHSEPSISTVKKEKKKKCADDDGNKQHSRTSQQNASSTLALAKA